MIKVLLASAEVAPFAKVGGLADVAGSLPVALAAQDIDIRVIMPKYRSVDETGITPARRLQTVYVPMPTRVSGCALDEALLPGSDVPVYFVEHNDYFNRPTVYGRNGGYPDELERLTFFCRAVIACFKGLNWEPDVIHLNDWHTSLIAAYTRFWDHGWGTLFTGHNLGASYQGTFDIEQFSVCGLDLGDERVQRSLLDGRLNLARLGFVFADLVNTVSPRYAREITAPEFGGGISDLASERAEDLSGILNGIDYSLYDPTTGKGLPAAFGPDDLAGKAVCKAAAQRAFGLPEDPEEPLVAVISRLDAQKGIELITTSLDEFKGMQLAVLGSGDPRYEWLLAEAGASRPNIAVKLVFSDDLARLLYAGADIFLMPSRYEPCGLGQMMALAYGTVPVVRATGGLADSVFETGEQANGFVFEEYDSRAMLAALGRARAAFHDPKRWSHLVAGAFASDYSWDVSARRYAELYRKIAQRTNRR